MKLITRHTDYAIQALCHMAARDDAVSVTELCRELNMPRAFLRGLMQKLTTHGYLHSAKGRGGGFRLAKSPSRIRVIDVLKVFQGPLELSQCTLKKRPCPRKGRCTLRKELKSIEEVVKRRLGAATIASLIDRPR